MNKRKLGAEEKALSELIAQAFDLRSTIGKNAIALKNHFRKTNNTAGSSMLRALAAMVRQKCHKNFSGSIEARVGPERAGSKLAVPIVQDGVRKVHERITDASPYSGKELVHGHPISYTLYDRKHKVLVSAGYRAGTRLKEDEGELIGPDQISTLLLYTPLLNDPSLPGKLKAPPKRERQERARKTRKRLEEILGRMPKGFAAYAAKRNVNLKALATIDMLEAGQYLKEEKWSALLWALDPGKHHNILNWYKARMHADDLPDDVKQAWISLNVMPHRTTEMEFLLLAAYRLQSKPERSKGIAGEMREELSWLAKQGENSQARKLYGRAVNLKQNHAPAKFYTGPVPLQPMSIEEQLEEPFWSYADREGILRRFPLSVFRKKWNRIVLNRVFGDARAFTELCTALHRIYRLDHQAIAAARKPDEAKTQLGNNYNFVRTIFGAMSDKGSADYGRLVLPRTTRQGSADRVGWSCLALARQGSTAWALEKLLQNTPVHASEKNFKRLFTFARAAKLKQDVEELRLNNKVFTEHTLVYSAQGYCRLKAARETLPDVNLAGLNQDSSTVSTLVQEFDALRERLPRYRTLKELGAGFTAKLETMLDWKDHAYDLLPTRSFEVNNAFHELLANARANSDAAYVSPSLAETIDEFVTGIREYEKCIQRKREQLAGQGYDLDQMTVRLRAVRGKTYVQKHQFGISFVKFALPHGRCEQEQGIDEVIGQLSYAKRAPDEKYVKRVADALAKVEKLQEFSAHSVLLDEESIARYDAGKGAYDLLGVCNAGSHTDRAIAMNKVFKQIVVTGPFRMFRPEPGIGYVMRDVPPDKVFAVCQQVYEQSAKNNAECRIKLV